MSPMLPSGTDSARMLACWRLVSSSSVRPATADDAPAVARLQLTVWQQAFAAVLPAAALGTDPAVHAASWADRIEQGGPVLLAVEGVETVGFAAVAGAAGRNLLEPVGEIEVLHVVPRWGRRGHGGRLLVASAAQLRRLGARTGRWWVPQVDTATARFLTAAGWVEDGVRRELETGAAPLVELRWSGSLDLVAI
jgi:GNAT superfamily N-acetyltransferase